MIPSICHKFRNCMHAAARNNGNEKLKTYHRGAYGSKRPEEWSCCGYCGKNQEGCFSVSDDSMVNPRRQPHRSHTMSYELSKKLSTKLRFDDKHTLSFQFCISHI